MTDLDDGTAAALHLFSQEVADDPHAAYRQLREQCPVAKGDLGGHDGGAALAVRGRALGAAAPRGVHVAERPEPRRAAAAPARGRPAGPHRLPAHPQPAVRAARDREARTRRPRARSASCSTASPTAGRATSTRSSPRRCRRASSSRSWACRTPTCPMFFQWRDNTIRPDVAARRHRGRRAHPRRRPAHAISDYFRERIAERRAEPDDTLLSKIVHATIDGRPLDEAELLGISHLLLLGGLDTVTATLDCMIEYLATHPEQRQRLVDDPSRIPAAIEELLRWLTPVMVVPRAAAQDITLHDVEIKKGDGVTLVLGRRQRRRGRVRGRRRRLRPRAEQAPRLRRRPPPLPRRPPRPHGAADRARGAARPHPRLPPRRRRRGPLLHRHPPGPLAARWCGTVPMTTAMPRRAAGCATGSCRSTTTSSSRPTCSRGGCRPRWPTGRRRSSPATTAARCGPTRATSTRTSGSTRWSGGRSDEWSMAPADFDEMRRGCWDIHARIADMDLAGIGASVCFPSLIAGFCGSVFSQSKDPELGLACVQRVERLAPRGVGRHLPGPHHPDADHLAAATRRWPPTSCAPTPSAGFRALSFAEMPAKLGLPSLHTGHWDPLLAACEETEHRGVPPHRLVVVGAAAVRRPALRAAAHAVLGERLRGRGRLAVVGRVHPLPRACGSPCRRAASGWVNMLADRVDYVLDHSGSGIDGGALDRRPPPERGAGRAVLVLLDRRPEHARRRARALRPRPRAARGRLPARRLDLARHPDLRARHDRPPARPTSIDKHHPRRTPRSCSDGRPS